MSKFQSSALILFIKAPQAGRVKTRLGRSIGFEASCQLYRCFVLDWMARLQGVGVPILVFFSPAEEKPLIQSWLGHQRYYPQTEGDLGDRMEQAFSHGFELGFERLLIVGSDSPDLPLAYLEQGFTALAQDRVVIGPSEDGGYFTLGFSRSSWCPAVFHQMAWSTSGLYAATLDKLRSQPLGVLELPTWYDVDTLEDLQAFYQRNRERLDLTHSMDCISAQLMEYIAT